MKQLAATAVFICLTSPTYAQSVQVVDSDQVPTIVTSIEVTQTRHSFEELSFEDCASARIATGTSASLSQNSECSLAHRFWGKSKQTLTKTFQHFTPKKPQARKNILSKLGKIEFNF